MELEHILSRSRLAQEFWADRARLNQIVEQFDNRLLKRFYNLDHNTYLDEGHLSTKVKELMGLSVSLALRCNDCVFYHIIKSAQEGASRAEVEETLNIALVVGGSIVIPHLRKAYEMVQEIWSPR